MVFLEAARARSLARRGRQRQLGRQEVLEKVESETTVVGQEATKEQEFAVGQELQELQENGALQETEAIKKLQEVSASKELQEAGTGQELEKPGADKELQNTGEVKQLQESKAGEDLHMGGAGKELQVVGAGSKVQDVGSSKEESVRSEQESTIKTSETSVEIQSQQLVEIQSRQLVEIQSRQLVEIQSQQSPKLVEIESPKKRGRKRKVAATRDKIGTKLENLMTTPNEGLASTEKLLTTHMKPVETPEKLEELVEKTPACLAAAVSQAVEEKALGRFIELCCAEFLKRFPGSEVAREHIGRRCRERWAGLGGLDKRPFLRMAEDVNENTEEAVEVEEAKPLGAGKRRKKKKDSLLPKRAPSGYILFSREERPRVNVERPELRGAQVIRELARRWSTETPKVKSKYEKMAACDRERYFKEKEEIKRRTAGSDG